MIITRYLIREIFKNQFAILFILFLIFFCQKLVRILDIAANGGIPTNLVLSLLGLGVAEMAQLMLPLSLFLGLLMTLSRMCTENEVIAMYACGASKSILICSVLFLALITAIFASVNVMWFSPWSSRYQGLVMAEAKANPGMAMLIGGHFKIIGNYVLFVGNIKENKFEHVFLAQLKSNNNTHPAIIIADYGYITQRSDGSKIIILYNGTCYEGSASILDFRVTDFIQYQVIIGYQRAILSTTAAEQMMFPQLWDNSSLALEACAELHWRLTLVASVLIMAMIVMPLSIISPSQSGFLRMFCVMLLYLIFFLLHTSLRSNGAKGKINPMLWMWLINGIYLIIALILNVWDSILARKLRALFYTRHR